MNAALREESAYRAIFQQPAAVNSWLPDQLIITQFQEADFIAVDNNHGGANLTAADLPGAQAASQGTTLAKLEELSKVYKVGTFGGQELRDISEVDDVLNCKHLHVPSDLLIVLRKITPVR